MHAVRTIAFWQLSSHSLGSLDVPTLAFKACIISPSKMLGRVIVSLTAQVSGQVNIGYYVGNGALGDLALGTASPARPLNDGLIGSVKNLCGQRVGRAHDHGIHNP